MRFKLADDLKLRPREWSILRYLLLQFPNGHLFEAFYKRISLYLLNEKYVIWRIWRTLNPPLIGQTNFEILNFRRANIMPELNYSYRQLSFDQGDHPKLLFGENLPKQIKDISETNKVRFAISRKSTAPSNTISISPHKSPQNKIQPSFLYGVRRASKGRPQYMQSQSYPYHQNYRKQQSQWYQSDSKNYN